MRTDALSPQPRHQLERVIDLRIACSRANVCGFDARWEPTTRPKWRASRGRAHRVVDIVNTAPLGLPAKVKVVNPTAVHPTTQQLAHNARRALSGHSQVVFEEELVDQSRQPGAIGDVVDYRMFYRHVVNVHLQGNEVSRMG